jgi:phage-related protein (TIGR01555 family)
MSRKSRNRKPVYATPTKKPEAAPSGLSAPSSLTLDSFQNFAMSLGMGTDNQLSASTYGFNPITRQRVLLEWIHRSSWLGGVAVDVVAEDMTRGGITIKTTMPPEEIEDLQQALVRRNVWTDTAETIKYGRLYGGAIGVIMIDGQDFETPLDPSRVADGQFKGILPLDRWQVDAQFSEGHVIDELGPDIGLPKYYKVVAEAPGIPRVKIHHSRVLRSVGIKLPYWQAMQENMWGLSIYERLYDRLIAFDAATQGAAQLIGKMYTRIYQIDGLREIMAMGGKPMQGLLAQVDWMRRMQTNEGITLIDAKDNFIPHQQTVSSGITDALVQFGQQLSGALQIPLIRLFGQSPTGLNSSGESDLRTYYDNVRRCQERDLRQFLTKVVILTALSEGIPLPEKWTFDFNSLWEMTDAEKAGIASQVTDTALKGFESGVVDRGTALKEMRERGRIVGAWTNVTDQMIEEAEMEPPPASAEAKAQAMEEEAMMAEATGGPEAGEKPESGGSTGDRAYRLSELTAGHGRAIRAMTARDALSVRDGMTMSEFQGIPVVIECEKGQKRWPDGPFWPSDYGYIRGTSSAEGEDEQCDIFVGPHHESPKCFVFSHFDDHGQFEELKVMLGYQDVSQAKSDYRKAYGRPARGGVRGMPVKELLGFLETADVTKPLARNYNLDARPQFVRVAAKPLFSEVA